MACCRTAQRKLASLMHVLGMPCGGETDGKAIIRMTLLEQYIAGWRAHDVTAILATLAPDCVVIESFGPVYRGHDWVARWISTWLAEDGQVIDWTVHHLAASTESEAAEWTFHYTWRGEEKSFDGATIAKLQDGKLSYLREYATTAALYDWRGAWRAF